MTAAVAPRTVSIQVGDLLGVRHRRREAHERRPRRGEVDDHLLPHRAAVAVLEVVHLVEHDVAEAVERGRRRVDHVAQHLGGHHHDRRVAVDRVVAGEQPDARRAVDARRGRRTSGSRAPSAAWCRRPCRPSASARSIAYSATTRLARAGRRGDEHAAGPRRARRARAAGSGRAGTRARPRRWRGTRGTGPRQGRGVVVVGRGRGGGRAGRRWWSSAGHGRRRGHRGARSPATTPSSRVRAAGPTTSDRGATTITASDASTAIDDLAAVAAAALSASVAYASVRAHRFSTLPMMMRRLVEDVHRDRHREQRVRILARRDHRRERHDDHGRLAAPARGAAAVVSTRASSRNIRTTGNSNDDPERHDHQRRRARCTCRR